MHILTLHVLQITSSAYAEHTWFAVALVTCTCIESWMLIP